MSLYALFDTLFIIATMTEQHIKANNLRGYTSVSAEFTYKVGFKKKYLVYYLEPFVTEAWPCTQKYRQMIV